MKINMLVLLMGFAGNLACSAAADPRVLYQQPTLEAIAGRMLVQARAPEGEMALISWQKNPNTPTGAFVPVRWPVGQKTGLDPAGDLAQWQMGMADRAGSTAAQVFKQAVGAYLNSDDLSAGGRDAAGNPLPGSGGYKMMVTPEIRFPMKAGIRPLADPNTSLRVSFDLQVPTAVDQQKSGSHTYVNPCLVLVDPKTKVRISYIVVAFSKGYRIVKESVGYDDPSRSWMLHTYMSTNQQWMTLQPGSAVFHDQPWKGWKHFSFAITPANARAAFSALHAARPEIACSTNPADYVLQSFHLNAELKYNTAHAELGWSLRDAKVELVAQ